MKLNLGGGSHWSMDGWINVDPHHIDPACRHDVENHRTLRGFDAVDGRNSLRFEAEK